MTAGAGSLDIIARRCGPRTVLERVRYDGISRCSRAFASGDAALVVLSALGPGVVRGDNVRLTGHLRDGSRMIVTSQTTTRLLGGITPSHSVAAWMVDDGATLDLVGEPLIAAADAQYDAFTTIELGHSSRALISDIACVPTTANVHLRTRIRQAGHEIYYDAVDAARADPLGVGTFAAVGFAPDTTLALLAALDAAADAQSDVTIGVGELSSGVFARVLGLDAWAIRSALIALRSAARSAMDPLTAC